jgi:hypothetical protein
MCPNNNVIFLGTKKKSSTLRLAKFFEERFFVMRPFVQEVNSFILSNLAILSELIVYL